MIDETMKSLGMSERSINNPSIPEGDPSNWPSDFGGGMSDAGVPVGSRTALTYPAVWRAITLISNDIAKIPLCVFRRLADGGRERDTDHPATMLLKSKANDSMTAYTMKQVIQSGALLGNGYAFIERDNNHVPTGIIPLSPVDTYPAKANGVVSYVTKIGNSTIGLPAESVLHIKGLGFNGLVGYGLMDFAKDSFGLGLAAQKFGSVVFKNGARPSVLIEHPGNISQEASANLRKSWDKMFSGVENAHRTAVLEEGMKATVMAMDNEAAQLMQLREFELRMVADWFGIPPHKVGDTTRTAFASLEQENQSYLDEALDPWMVNWEQECNVKLLSKEQRDNGTHFFEFIRAALVRADLATRYDAYASALQNGWMSRDEVRKAENLNPIPDGEGETFFMPLNMDQTGSTDNVDPAPVDTNEADRAIAEQSHRQLMGDTVRRMAKRAASQAKKAAKKPNEFLNWLDKWQDENLDTMAGAFVPQMRVTSLLVGFDHSIAALDAAKAFVNQFRQTMVRASDCQPDELTLSVDCSLIDFEDTVTQAITDDVMSGKYGKV